MRVNHNKDAAKCGNTNPSTQGSGRKVSRFIPMTLMIVLIADTPSHPVLRATLAGCKNNNIFVQYRCFSISDQFFQY